MPLSSASSNNNDNHGQNDNDNHEEIHVNTNGEITTGQLASLISALKVTMDRVKNRMDALESKEPTKPNPPLETETDKRLRILEEQLLARGNNIHIENNRRFEPVGDQLPNHFTLTDVPKFKGVEDPLNHIRAFKDYMSIKGVKQELFTRIFPTSLEPIPRQWYYSLDPKSITTWDEVAIEFSKQYADNVEI